MKKILKAGYWLILVLLIILAGLITGSRLNIPGGYNLFVVQSGSMEPAIKKMGIVVVKPADNYQKGDVVTIQESANSDVTITHRIHQIEQTEEGKLYTLKGDANEDPDGEKRVEESILGEVIFSAPYLGYPITFSQTQIGFIVLVIIPAVIIVYSELLTIKNEVQKLVKNRKKENKDETDSA
jgi:signal peptidase